MASIRDPKPSKNQKKLTVFQGFLIFSLTAKKPPKSSKIDPKSSENRAKIAILAAFGGLLGAILALLGAILAHLGALGRHLGSSWGSWAPSCCQRCRNIAPTCAKTAQIRTNIAQNDLQETLETLIFTEFRASILHCRGTPKSKSFQTSVPMRLEAEGSAAEAQPYNT